MYPQDTLHDMWFGRRAEELRALMKKDELPTGCELCYKQFISLNFGGLLARQFDFAAPGAYPPRDVAFTAMPTVIGFEISNLCNLECTMCTGYFSSLIRENREHLPPLPNPYDDDFVRQLEPFIPHLRQAKFLGGEPFLIKTYYQIWELMATRNPDIDVSITTNGTVLNTKVRDAIGKLQANIIMSVDSLEKDNYERIRINARFDRVMEHLRYFMEYAKTKRTTLTLAFCPMQQNWKEIPRLLEFCNEKDIHLYFNTVTWPREAALSSLSDEELRAIVAYLGSVTAAGDSETRKSNNAKYADLTRQIWAFQRNPPSAPPDVPSSSNGDDRLR
jgi:MoaA/NifB/PqqE/SkfB family radical SAM enzyme